jgi:transketolase
MDFKKFVDIGKLIRKDIIQMLKEAGSGHPGGSLSCVELIVALYWHFLKQDPNNPCDPKRDRLIFSKGHVCPTLYACLAHLGYFEHKEIMTLRKAGSRLQGHPAFSCSLPGVETSTGSLGQGLSIGIGMALGLRLDKIDSRVYVLLGDGELQSGQVWEAVMSASHYKLDNLCAIVDLNGLQIDGPVSQIMNIEPIKDKWISFGWNVIEINGHNYKEIFDAYTKAKEIKGKPTVVIAKTVKGKGVSFMENNADWHGKAPNEQEMKIALEEIEKGNIGI